MWASCPCLALSQHPHPHFNAPSTPFQLCIVVPFIIPVFLPLGVGFFWVRARYLATSREVKRWEATSRSPVFASFSAILKVGGWVGGGEAVDVVCCPSRACVGSALPSLWFTCRERYWFGSEPASRPGSAAGS
jgi:hypothetical protein